MPDISVVLAEDHTVVREGMRRLLEDAPGITVLAEVGDGPAAIEEVLRLHPDVLLAGIRMSGMSGLEVAHRLQESASTTRVVIMSAYDDAAYVVEAMKAGAAGYLLKTVCSRELIDAIRTVARGETVLHPTVARHVARLWGSQGPDAPQPPSCPLTLREQEVLCLLAKGLHNRDIALALHVSPRTVAGHLNNLFAKLNVSTRTSAVMCGISRGLLPTGASGEEDR